MRPQCTRSYARYRTYRLRREPRVRHRTDTAGTNLDTRTSAYLATGDGRWNATPAEDVFMDLLVFAMLGGLIGWELSRMTGACTEAWTVTTNVVIGSAGALLAGWFLVPRFAESDGNDFTETALLVLLGAVGSLTVAAFVRQASGWRTARRRQGPSHHPNRPRPRSLAP